MSYQLDPTASLEANLIVGEPIEIRDSESTFGGLVFIPNAPFFSKDFVLEYTDGAGNSRVLTYKKDYVFSFPLLMRDLPTGVGAYAALNLIQYGLSGTIRPTYRAVGGNVRINSAAILQFVSNRQINHLTTRYVSVPFPLEYADAERTIVFPSDTFDNLSTLVSRRGTLFLGVEAQPLPPDQAVVQYDGLIQKKTGELLVGQSGESSGGSSGNTGGSGTIADLVKIEGGNTQVVNIGGTVSVSGLNAVAKDSSIQQLIAAVEAGAGTSGGALESGGNLQALAETSGSAADPAYTGLNKASMISLLKGILTRVTSVLNIRALDSATDSVTVVPSGTQDVRITSSALPSNAAREDGNLLTVATAAGTSVTKLSEINDRLNQNLSVTVVNQPITQAISATSLPLPANAAQESGGNLQAIRVAVGAQSDAAYGGSGDTSLLSSVKGVYAAIKGVLNIRALSSATDSVTVQGGNVTPVKIDGSQVIQPISVATLPLPSGAAQESGNLQTAATASQATSATIGNVGDGTYGGTGAGTLVSLLKGLYAKLSGVLNTRSLTAQTDTVRVEAAAALPIGTSQLPASLGKQTAGSSLAVTLASDESPVAVTSTAGALALDSSIQALIQAVQNQVSFDSTIWFDSTVTPVVYYVRREVADPITRDVTVAWETMAGQPASPVVANLSAVSDDKNVVAESVRYLAQTSGLGYASGDQLIHFYGLDVNNVPPTVAYSFWFNATGGNTLTQAPSAGDYASSSSQTVSVTSTVLPANAAQENGGNLQAAKTALGDVSDAAYAGAGNTTVIGAIKGVVAKLSTTLNIRTISSGTDSITTVPSGTQSISAATLPLPADAARETGNLQNLAVTAGGVSDVAYAGTGSASLVSILKGLHVLMSGQLQTRALSSTTDSVTTVPSGIQQVSLTSVPLASNAAREDGNLQTAAAGITAGNQILTDVKDKLYGTVQVSVANQPATQAVSVANLPLPTGAASESGNLQVIANSIGVKASGATAPTGGSGSLGWLSGIYQKLLDGIGVNVTQLPSLPAGTNNIGRVEVSNLPATQPISAATLPLPTGASRETGGNLEIVANKAAEISTNTGAVSDAAFGGSGNGSLISVAKGIYARLAGTLNTRALSSGSDSITTVPSGTQQVSASSLPLPTGAATETGNLLTVSTATTQTVTALGSTADAAFTGANTTSVTGVLKGVYAAIKGVLNIRSLTSGTDSVTVVPSGTQTTATTQLPASLGRKNAASSLSVTLSSDDVPLPVSIQTSSLALDASVQAVTAAVKASKAIDTTVWFDSTTTPITLYLRRETLNQETGQITISWSNVSGAPATPTLANLTVIPPASGGGGGTASAVNTQSVSYLASASGTGYTSGDRLIRAYGLNTDAATPTVAYDFWFNASTGTVLATPPTSGTYEASSSQTVSVSSSALPANAAREAGGHLESVRTSVGQAADIAYAGQITETQTTRTAPTVDVAGKLSYKFGQTAPAVITCPSGIALDDYWVIVASADLASSFNSTTLPAGWVKILGSISQGDGQSFGIWIRKFEGDTTSISFAAAAEDALAFSFCVKDTAGVEDSANLVVSTQTTSLNLGGLSVTTTQNNCTLLAFQSTDTSGGSGSVVFTLPDNYTNGYQETTNAWCANAISQRRDLPAGTYTTTGAGATAAANMNGYIGVIAWRPKVTSQQVTVDQDMTLISGIKGVYQRMQGGLDVAVTNFSDMARRRDARLAYKATVAGTGYSIDDVLIKTLAVQPTTLGQLEVLEVIWLNMTTGALMAQAPTPAHLQLLEGGASAGGTSSQVEVTTSALPTNAARETGGNLALVQTATGAPADAAYGGSGNATVVSALKGVYSAISTLAASMGASVGKKYYRMIVPGQAVAANKLYWDLFNGSSNGTILKIVSLHAFADTDTAVTGVVAAELMFTRTTAIGTGGTVATIGGSATTVTAVISLMDTTVPLPDGVSARLIPTGGATASTMLARRWLFTEETNAGSFASCNLIDYNTPPITVRPGEGVRLIQGAVASVGNIGFEMVFEAS